jgi:predicted Rossmann-fold nucleotide-binding protein
VQKKVIYISGPITGVDRYWEAFEQAEEDLIGLGHIPLSPAHLPQGMTNEQYMRINFAMIDSADAVVFLPGWSGSPGALLENNYCRYTGKSRVYPLAIVPRELQHSYLKALLEEVIT